MSKSPPDHRSREAGVPALGWLRENPQGALMLQTAREMLALEAVLAQALPAALAQRARVAHVEGGALTVMVPGAAHAARLRQLARSAAARLQDAGWPIERIVVRIDARCDTGQPQTSNGENRALDAQALRAFEALRNEIEPGPLSEAINRLLARHRS